MFESILETTTTSGLTYDKALICILTSCILGAIIALVHMKTSKYTKNFVITLAILPVLVQLVIMMVNGNLGTSIAIMGAFSLVRFRSIAGNSKEITSVFFAMVIGLAVGMGHIAFATLVTVIVGLLIFVYSKIDFGTNKENERKLKVIIPENLNFIDAFNDIFEKYTVQNILQKVKTTNMGSMYELNYHIVVKDDIDEKKFIDEIRCRNGNLNIMLSREEEGDAEL